MAKQNYSNHIRYYPPHHFVFYPVMLALMAFAAYKSWQDAHQRSLWIILFLLAAVITWLAWMLRQHYALTLQDRLALAELRYRYYVLTGSRLEPLEGQLGEGRLFALRFAPDGELIELVQRTLDEKLSPDAIKKSIRDWKADNRRV